MSAYVIGIDCGNTAIKAAVFDELGKEVAVSGLTVSTQFPKPGHAEADLEALWQACTQVLQDVVRQAAVPPTSIKALGTSGHGNGLFLLDRHGDPLVSIKSLDSRTEAWVKQAQQREDYLALRARNHQGVWPSQTATLLQWLKQHEPKTYQQATTLLFCKDYINYRLTGALSTDHGDLSASGLFDFQQNSVSPAVLSWFGIEEVERWIPPVLECDQIMGTLRSDVANQTGLVAGTPVVAGMFDVVASAIGAGTWQEGQASLVVGSWSINQVVSGSVPDNRLFMSCLFPGGRYLAMENSATSASNLEWFVREFFAAESREAESRNQSVFSLCNDLVAGVKADVSLPLFHPYLYGSRENAQVGANFSGMRGWHTRADLLYAVYEGIVFGHLEHVERLRQFGVNFDDVLLSGGGARSPVWCQMFADILAVPVHVPECGEAGAKGVAMAAFSAIDCYSTLAESIQAGRGDLQTYLPRTEQRPLIQARKEKYKKLSAWLSEWVNES